MSQSPSPEVDAPNADIEPGSSKAEQDYSQLPDSKARILLMSILVVALCGIVYELIIGTVSSYLLGNSVYQFSLTVGFFMFAMGVGSYLSRFLGKWLIEAFIYVELALGIIGGICSIALFMTFPYAPWLYQTVMLAFIMVIGILVGLEIPLLTRVLAARKGTRRSIADVMSLDYVGALIGSVGFPLFLLPSLGLISASFAIGLINCLVALTNILWLRDHIRHPKTVLVINLVVLGVLVVLTATASRITAFAQQHLYFDQIVWNKQTAYQSLVMTNNWLQRDLRLYIDGHLQFSATDEHRYHESLVHPVMSFSGPHRSVLVLGGGDGLAVRELLKYPDIERIDLVDIDPEMTRLGRDNAPLRRLNRDSLHDPRVKIYNIDAFVFIKERGQAYDRVIIDFPDPHNEAISKLYSVEFYQMLRARLNEDAVIVTQSSSPYFTRSTFWSIARTMEEIYPRVGQFQISIPSFGVWGFNLAFMSPLSRPTEQWPAGLHYMSQAVFDHARHFSNDVARPPQLTVNSIFEPSLYQVYLNDLKRNPILELNKTSLLDW